MAAPTPIIIDGLPTLTINGLNVANSIDGVNDYLPIYQNASTSTLGINRNTLLGLSSQPLGLTDSQSPTNKTFNNTNSLTVKDNSLTIQNASSTTKQFQFLASGITAGQTRIYTVPDYNATLATLAGAETLTNKTLTSSTINSPIITNATLSADSITGFTTSNNGSIYGVSVAGGLINGSSLVSSSVTGTQLATNAVGASNLSTTAISLGKTIVTSGNSGLNSTSPLIVPGMTVTVTIPAGGRMIEVYALLPNYSVVGSGGAQVGISIWDGNVGTGTQLQEATSTWNTNGNQGSQYVSVLVTPSAGSKTYNIGYRVNTNSITTNFSSTVPGYIAVIAL